MSAKVLEESDQKILAILLKEAPCQLHPVIEPRVLHEVSQGSTESCLGITGSEYKVTDPGLHDSPGTHGAGFQCDIKITSLESPGTQGCRCISDGVQFRVARGILVLFPHVEAASNDGLVFHDDGTDRNLPPVPGCVCKQEGFLHKTDLNVHDIIILQSAILEQKLLEYCLYNEEEVMKFRLLVWILLISTMGLAQDMRWDKGMEFFKQGDYENAILRFESLVSDYPDVYQYHQMAGRCYFKIKDIDKAYESFKKAYELNGDALQVAFDYAQILQVRQDYDTLSDVIEKIDASNVKGTQLDTLLYLRGMSRFYKQNYEIAAKDLAKIQSEARKTMSAYYLGYSYYKSEQYEKALKAAEQVNENQKVKAIQLKLKVLSALVEEAKDADTKNKYRNMAVPVASELVAINQDADSYYLAGKTAMGAGQFDTAIPWFEKAAEQGNGYASYYLSFLYIKSGKLNEALNAMEVAEPKLKDDLNALKNLYCNRGHIFHVNENFSEAIRWYEKGDCSAQLELARKGQKAEQRQQALDSLIDEYKKLLGD